MEGFDTGIRKGTGDITDAEFDDLLVRIGLLEAGNPFGNVAEQVRRL